MHGVERAHGLPPARRQARRRHGSGNRYLDNLYEPFRLCVELDGSAAHPAEGRWRDTRRDNANLAQGVRTLRYGWPDVTEYRCRTAAEIAETLDVGAIMGGTVSMKSVRHAFAVMDEITGKGSAR